MFLSLPAQRLPIAPGGQALLGMLLAEDAYLRLDRRAVVKWYEGLQPVKILRYRAGYVVEIVRPDGNGTSWVAAIDVDYPTAKRARVRGIGTRLMAFLHATRVGAETTMHRYFYERDPSAGARVGGRGELAGARALDGL
ncbi:MAG TPA: hypothetical protein VK760_12840 [Candidatus Acidoferrales bacterium]|nr:hypothetical protein [Candidatus Acidoferrales bacterium]